MSAFDTFLGGLTKGRDWELMGDSEKVRTLLSEVYDERCHRGKHHKDAYQVRVNLQKADDAASYAGWITADNDKSGPYQGTSFVWFPGANGSVAVLVIGTEGSGPTQESSGGPATRDDCELCRACTRGDFGSNPTCSTFRRRCLRPPQADGPTLPQR